MKEQSSRIEVLDFLRGIASLAVALHHFNLFAPGPIYDAFYRGQLGVQVFFVISGFIIPYSLYRGGYRLPDFPVFVLKRVIRLDPPYLVTIALIIALGVFSWYVPFQQGLVFKVTWQQVLLHFAYVNVFFGYPWLNDVFWTLAIEFQYYLLMGLAYPLVFSRRSWVRLSATAALGALAFLLPSPVFIFYFVFLFLMGITTCQYRVGMIGRGQYAALLAASVAGSLLSNGLESTLAGLFAVFCILFLRMRNAVFIFLGQISYSLYLIHGPVGLRALNVLRRLTGWETTLAGKVALVLAATAVSIFAAYLLYRFVERPSQEWSAALRYRRARQKPEAAPTRAEETEQLNPAF
ncbi:MAG TPA: acyltransferase [Pyrinomonadaceae bacterium]|nr:acyltransferase [Pyrinomonadaceae bacterium]